MTDKEREAFNGIVEAETDSFQRVYLDGILSRNTDILAPLSERCALPAVCRLWRKK